MTDAQSRERFEDIWCNGDESRIPTLFTLRDGDSYVVHAIADAWSWWQSAWQAALSHPTPQRDEHITRILDQLSGAVGTFLQGDGQKLVEYVWCLEAEIDSLRRERDATRDDFVNLDDYIQGCLV